MHTRSARSATQGKSLCTELKRPAKQLAQKVQCTQNKMKHRKLQTGGGALSCGKTWTTRLGPFVQSQWTNSQRSADGVWFNQENLLRYPKPRKEFGRTGRPKQHTEHLSHEEAHTPNKTQARLRPLIMNNRMIITLSNAIPCNVHSSYRPQRHIQWGTL